MSNPKVAFIAHPLDMKTLATISGWPKAILELSGMPAVKRRLEKKNPFVFAQIPNIRSVSGAIVDLIGIACPLLPDQMVSLNQDTVIEKIGDAVRLAESRGADIAALGGFTSVVGNEGEEVSRLTKIAVTSGNTFTAALAIEAVESAIRLMGRLQIRKCAVLGATGDIGSACAEYFATKTSHLACAGRDLAKLERLASKIKSPSSGQITIHAKVKEAISDADVIISATSALTTIIDAESLMPGVVVCDVALPANIAREVSRKRSDALVFEGGLSRTPFEGQIKDSKWSSLMPKNAIYGCLAEALVLGFERKFENYSIGRGNISQNKILQISEWAHKHGFGMSEYFCGDRFYGVSDICNIQKNLLGVTQYSRSRECV